MVAAATRKAQPTKQQHNKPLKHCSTPCTCLYPPLHHHHTSPHNPPAPSSSSILTVSRLFQDYALAFICSVRTCACPPPATGFLLSSYISCSHRLCLLAQAINRISSLPRLPSIHFAIHIFLRTCRSQLRYCLLLERSPA